MDAWTEHQKNIKNVFDLVKEMNDMNEWSNESTINKLKEIVIRDDDLLRTHAQDKELAKKLNDYRF